MAARRSLLALVPLLLPPASRAEVARALPVTMQAREGGGWRVLFAPGAEALPEGAAAALAAIGRQLAERPAGFGRVTVEGQASGPAEDASAARRLSLARAVAVRDALAAGGLATTQVDVRPLGLVAAGRDMAEILPPGAARRGGQGG